MSKMHLQWGDVEWACQHIVEQLKGEKFDMIVPIVRGGMIPAVIISELLGLKRVHPVKIQLRDGVDGLNDIGEWVEMVEKPLNILVVDDIMDSGATIDVMQEAFVLRSKESRSSCKFVAMLSNDDAKPKYFQPSAITRGITIQKDSDPDLWVVFPWDK